ncbi:hypothetical protein DPMN_033222 [Dreissena polymorpha]|uniref:Uncharacterized protein n=1 Tax=Dreissena polymorpha TaxID=45954 RepID=A0A9D4RJM8_DREPO|nr:hypothetical protein DPMN_033222 [Dreissena polymorpha]
MNLLTKFHEDRTINLASRVLTSHLMKNAPLPGGNAILLEANLLTMFHDDWTINVASRVLTRKNAPPPSWPYIIGTNLLTKFHKYRTINVTSRMLTRKNALPLNGTILDFVQDIIELNLQTKFYHDWKINVASRVLTRFYYSHIMKNAPPLMTMYELTGIPDD